MKNNLLKTIIIIVLVVAMLVGVAACSTRVDESRNTVKPDIKTAIDNYAKLSMKKSEFSGKVILKMYGQKNPNAAAPLVNTIGQEARLERIQNNGYTYIEGTLKSCNVSSTVDGLLNLLPDNFYKMIGSGNLKDKDALKSYLKGNTYFSLDMGHKNGNYNIKTTYHNGQANPQPYWAATDDDSINAFLSNNSINHSIKLSEYLMFSTFLDFSDIISLASYDNASKFLNSDTSTFLYNIAANNEKIYQLIFDTIAKYVNFLSSEEYDVFLDMYQTMLPKIKNWVKIGDTSVDASVNKNSLPVRMNTKITVCLDMPLDDLSDMIDILVAEENERKAIKTSLNAANIFLRGREGETGKFSVDFDIILDEKFSYDENSCSLEGVENDMFLDIGVENAARDVFKIANKSDIPADSNLDINNGIRISDGNDEGSDDPPDSRQDDEE